MISLRYLEHQIDSTDQPSTALAVLTVADDLSTQVTGEHPDVVDLTLRVAAIDGSGFVTFEENPILWARSVHTGYRTPYLYVEIAEDTFPQDAAREDSSDNASADDR